MKDFSTKSRNLTDK